MSDSNTPNPLSLDDAQVDLDYVSSLVDGLNQEYTLTLKALESSSVYQKLLKTQFEWNENAYLGKATSFRLPRKRDRVVQATHSLIRTRYDNGWLASGFYTLDDTTRIDQDINQLIPALFHAINDWSDFPRPFSGCSAYPAQQGMFIQITLDEFAKHLHSILKEGGAYAQTMKSEDCRDATLQYLQALIGPNPVDSLVPFVLDHAFSLSFFDIAWDYAYVLYHRTESWAALIAVTDTD